MKGVGNVGTLVGVAVVGRVGTLVGLLVVGAKVVGDEDGATHFKFIFIFSYFHLRILTNSR